MTLSLPLPRLLTRLLGIRTIETPREVRIVFPRWLPPRVMAGAIENLRREHPELRIEMVGRRSVYIRLVEEVEAA